MRLFPGELHRPPLASGITPCPLALARCLCPDGVDRLKDRCVTRRRDAGRYECGGDTLSPLTGEGERLVFAAAGDLEANMRLDGSWTLSGGTALTPVPGRPPSLTFAGGRVGGTGGCNRLTGPARVDGPTLTLGPLASTLMFCGPGVAAQERAFLTFLSGPLTARVEGTTLTLTDAAGRTLVFLRSGP